MNKHILKNDDALSEYLKSISRDMLRVAYSYFQDDAVVDDVIGETIYRVYKYRKRVRNPEYLKTWIILILINECKSEFNRRTKTVAFNESIAEATNDQNFNYVYDYIRILEPPLYDIVMLKTSNDYTFATIGEIMEINENTVKTNYYRAIDIMRKEFKAYE